MRGRIHDARITVITKDEEFKKDCQMKALCENKTLSEVVIKLLEKWLKQK